MFNTFQVKMRILMGTYALSAGYYDAYYKRAQQVLLTLFYVFLGGSDLPLKSSLFTQ
jgi:Asp-tRNA(Asn)/Glu-tRNA(Gln) amidotransferase A subunit family amidase